MVTAWTRSPKRRALGARRFPDEVIRIAVGRLRESALADAHDLAQAGTRDAIDAGLRAELQTVAAERSVWSAILQAADDADADAIVCGTQGHGAARRGVLGSVATGLVHHAQLPVLVVPEAARSASGPVLAFDDSPLARGAVQVAGCPACACDGARHQVCGGAALVGNQRDALVASAMSARGIRRQDCRQPQRHHPVARALPRREPGRRSSRDRGGHAC